MPVNLEMREYWRKTKWQGYEWGLRRRSYKALSPPFFLHPRVFGKPIPRSALLRILQRGLMGRNLGFHATIAHVIHLSLSFVVTRQITTDFSAIYRGSVTVTVQPLLRFFLHGLISPISSLGARGLAVCSAGFRYFSVSDPGTT